MNPRQNSAPKSSPSKTLHLEVLEPRCVLSGLGLLPPPIAAAVVAPDLGGVGQAGAAFVAAAGGMGAGLATTVPQVSYANLPAPTVLDSGVESLTSWIGLGTSSTGPVGGAEVPLPSIDLDDAVEVLNQNLAGLLPSASDGLVQTVDVLSASLSSPTSDPVGGLSTLAMQTTSGLEGAGLPSSVLDLASLGSSAGLLSLDLGLDVAGLIQVQTEAALLGSGGLAGLDLGVGIAQVAEIGAGLTVGGAQELLSLGLSADLPGIAQLDTAVDLFGSGGLAGIDLGVELLDAVQLDTALDLGGSAGLVGLDLTGDVLELVQLDVGAAAVGGGGLLGLDLGVQAAGLLDLSTDVVLAGAGGLLDLGLSADVAGVEVATQTQVGGSGGLLDVGVWLPSLGISVSTGGSGGLIVGGPNGGGAPLGTDQTIFTPSLFDGGSAGLLFGGVFVDPFSLGDETVAASDDAALLVGEEEELLFAGDLELIVSAEGEEAVGAGEALFSMWDVDAGVLAARVAPMLLAPNLGGAAAAMFLNDLSELAVSAAGAELASLQAAMEGLLNDLDALGASLGQAAAPLVPWLAAAALAAGAAVEIVRRETGRRKQLRSEAHWALGGL